MAHLRKKERERGPECPAQPLADRPRPGALIVEPWGCVALAGRDLVVGGVHGGAGGGRVSIAAPSPLK